MIPNCSGVIIIFFDTRIISNFRQGATYEIDVTEERNLYKPNAKCLPFIDLYRPIWTAQNIYTCSSWSFIFPYIKPSGNPKFIEGLIEVVSQSKFCKRMCLLWKIYYKPEAHTVTVQGNVSVCSDERCGPVSASLYSVTHMNDYALVLIRKAKYFSDNFQYFQIELFALGKGSTMTNEKPLSMQVSLDWKKIDACVSKDHRNQYELLMPANYNEHRNEYLPVNVTFFYCERREEGFCDHIPKSLVSHANVTIHLSKQGQHLSQLIPLMEEQIHLNWTIGILMSNSEKKIYLGIKWLEYCSESELLEQFAKANRLEISWFIMILFIMVLCGTNLFWLN